MQVLKSLSKAFQCSICGLLLFSSGCSGGYRKLPVAVHLTANEMKDFQHTDYKGRWGGAFVCSTVADPRTFNPITTQETTSIAAWGPLFSGLLNQNPFTFQFTPALATKYTESKDGKVWTFYLRHGVRWSDGYPFTADDVIFSLNVIYDPKVIDSARSLLTIHGKPFKYEELNKYTVRITLPAPVGAFLSNFAAVAVVPKHCLEAAWKAGKFNSTWGVNTPPSQIVGDGPYKMVDYEPGQSITYVRNPYYWRLAADGKQLPFMDGGVTEIVPDVNTEVLKFLARETDWVNLRPEDWDVMQQQARAGHYRLMNLGPGWGVSYISFNLNPPSAAVPAWKTKLFQSRIFRQAISYAINRQLICSTVFRGFAQPLWSYISPANKVYYNSKVPQYNYNPALAATLLKSIGLVKKNGVLTDRDGHAVTITLLPPSGNGNLITTCSIIQQELKPLGINMTVSPQDFNALVGRLSGSHNWESIALGFTGGFNPYDSANIWLSSGSLHVWNPNQAHPATDWEAQIDDIFNTAHTTVKRSARVTLFKRFQLIASTELPLIYLVEPDILIGVKNDVGNAQPSALGSSVYSGFMWELDHIYLKSQRRNGHNLRS